MAQNLAQLTDMWMVNPTMFDPTQESNQFSNFNNAALPWPPTLQPGLAGGPVNAATGKPIQIVPGLAEGEPRRHVDQLDARRARARRKHTACSQATWRASALNPMRQPSLRHGELGRHDEPAGAATLRQTSSSRSQG